MFMLCNKVILLGCSSAFSWKKLWRKQNTPQQRQKSSRWVGKERNHLSPVDKFRLHSWVNIWDAFTRVYFSFIFFSHFRSLLVVETNRFAHQAQPPEGASISYPVKDTRAFFGIDGCVAFTTCTTVPLVNSLDSHLLMWCHHLPYMRYLNMCTYPISADLEVSKFVRQNATEASQWSTAW